MPAAAMGFLQESSALPHPRAGGVSASSRLELALAEPGDSPEDSP